MKPKAAELDEIQRWMQSVIMHPGDLAEAVESPQARTHLDVPFDALASVIKPSRNLSSAVRLEIYVDAYYERLLECLREEFPATCHAVGPELFHALAFGYLQSHPSRCYTLSMLGAKFAEYLADCRLHEREMPADVPTTWPDFVIELADFERSLREVFDGPGIERMACVDGAALGRISTDDWARLRLTPAPCLRIARYGHAVHRYWSSVKRGDPPVTPEVSGVLMAIHRREYSVEWHELSEVQFCLLEALVAGRTLADAIEMAVKASPGADALLADGLNAWFAGWASSGFFISAGVAPAD